MFENFRVALIGLRSNKLRSVLTMLGVTIGVAAVIVLVSLGQAVDAFVREQFLSIGTDLLFVVGADNGRGGFVPLVLADATTISDVYHVPDALAVMPQLTSNRPVSVEGKEFTVRVQGVTPAYLDIRGRSVVAGRFFDQTDMDGLGRVAVLGQKTVGRLFPDVRPIGQSLRISGVRFTVIGVLNSVGGSAAFGAPGSDEDDVIVLPLYTVQTRLSGERVLTGDRPVGVIVVKARDSNSVNDAAEEIRQTLRQAHNINFRAEDDFQIFTQADLLSSFGNITGLLTIFLAVIAGISLLVGGIGIMNIMLVTVTERTREIGLRKAVGAQRHDILLQFLTEAIVLALLGGGIGILIAIGGIVAAKAVLPTLSVAVQASSVILATAISAGIGVIFGVYPANRAAGLNPIDALRYE